MSDPLGLVEAAASGSRLVALQALRDDLAVSVARATQDRDKASLGRLLMDVLGQIEAVEAAKPAHEGTALDELASRRRAAGRPNAAGATRATRKAK